LHEFKQQHPEVDLTTIVQHNSKYLQVSIVHTCMNTLCTTLISLSVAQGYIERGLQTIEHEKMSGIPGKLYTRSYMT